VTRRPTRGGCLASLLLTALLLPACSDNEYAPPPAPKVTVATPEQRDVTLYGEYTGTTRAVESVEVRARVKGFLVNMHFEPGDMVSQGDLLFTIDPEPFQTELQATRADRDRARAKLDLQQTELERTKALYEKQATSEIVFIKARAARDTAAASLDRAEADLRAAELDLDYAYVKAPISGRVGRRHVDVGNLVGSGEATVLTQIVRYSPLYVYFYLSERDVLALQELGSEQRERAGASWEERQPTEVQVGRANEDGYPHVGQIDFTALEIDPDTGTFEARGVLENRGELDEIIIPGTFVRVRIPLGDAEDALLVSERALGADQSGRYLLVVNDQNEVEQRHVVPGPKVDGMRVIEKGLEPADRVIVNGLQRARPGATVDPAPAEDDGPPSPGEATSSPSA
jgi:RND family efflux transporter MFP subunit